MTRSSAILNALREEILSRRGSLDDATNLTEVTITVKLVAGLARVRGVSYSEERVAKTEHRSHIATTSAPAT